MSRNTPIQTLLGYVAAAVLLPAATSFADEATNSPPNSKGEQARIEQYLGAIGTGRTVIVSSNLVSTSCEYALVNWLNSTNAMLRNLINARDFSVVLSKASPTNQNAYAVRQVTGLETNKLYIQIQIIPNGLACPEYHGVIDPKPLKLLAFWGEGG